MQSSRAHLLIGEPCTPAFPTTGLSFPPAPRAFGARRTFFDVDSHAGALGYGEDEDDVGNDVENESDDDDEDDVEREGASTGLLWWIVVRLAGCALGGTCRLRAEVAHGVQE